jgi:hypothetical protein
MKKRLGVRFKVKHTSTPGDNTGLLIELLRYAGVISREESADGTYTTVTMWCPLPKNFNHSVWQRQNVDRIKSFGIAAEPVEQNV